MVHQGQRLPFSVKPGEDLFAIHPRLDDFQCHLAMDRLSLLGHKHDAHAPFADLLQELIWADNRARALCQARVDRGIQFGSFLVEEPQGNTRAVEKLVGFVVDLKERLNLVTQRSIAGASTI